MLVAAVPVAANEARIEMTAVNATISMGADGGVKLTHDAGSLALIAGGTEHMRLSPSGKLTLNNTDIGRSLNELTRRLNELDPILAAEVCAPACRA